MSSRRSTHVSRQARCLFAALIALVAIWLPDCGLSSERALAQEGMRTASVSCSLPPISVASGSFPRTAHVGFPPDSLATSEKNNRVFAVERGPANDAEAYLCPGTVVTLDARTGAVVRAVHVGTGPIDTAVSDKYGRLLVANGGDYGKTATNAQGSVTVLDAASGAVITTIPLHALPGGVSVNDTSGAALVITQAAGKHGHTMVMLDVATGKILAIHSFQANDFTVDTQSGDVLLSTAKGIQVLGGRSGKVIRSFPAGTCNGGTLFVDQAAGHAVLAGPHNDICLVNVVDGKLLHTAHDAHCSGAIPQRVTADRHLFLSASGAQDSDGYICLLDLTSGKVLLHKDIGPGMEMTLTMDPAAHVLIEQSQTYTGNDLNWYVRSTRTGRRVRKVGLALDAFAHVTPDTGTGRLFFLKGHTVIAYDPVAGKQVFTAKNAADNLGPSTVIASTHRLFAAAGDASPGVVTVFCTQADCK